jgi:beta-glucosidase/6-phospho-beta-glucosidase/beta-galactosidase
MVIDVQDVQAASEWLYIVPWGIGKTLVWLTQRYQNPQIFVTENGEPQTVAEFPDKILP